MLMNFLVAGYYIYSIIENGSGYGHFRLSMAVLCVGCGLAIAFRLHRKMFVPKTLTLKEDLDDKKVPENVKIQTAMKIVKMKEDVKAVAAASA